MHVYTYIPMTIVDLLYRFRRKPKIFYNIISTMSTKCVTLVTIRIQTAWLNKPKLAARNSARYSSHPTVII